MRSKLTAIFGALLVISALVPAAAWAQEIEPPPPTAVVAIVDTGINPYNVAFRDDSPWASVHPSEYIPGFPADAEALNLTLDAATYAEAVAEDCELWKTVVPNKLYWIPGTKIVGAISTLPASAVTCSGSGVPSANTVKILDQGGHGTMTASRATSPDYGACHECRVVVVQFPGSVNLVSPGGSTAPTVAAIEWAAANSSWIDAQSNSWGPIVPGWDPSGAAGLLTAGPTLVKSVENVSSKHLAFWASGNGAAFRGGVLGHPTLLSPHLTPSAIIVGGHDSGYMNVWPGFSPHLVSDSCSSWAAHRDSIEGSGDSVGGGTSAATPYVAGGAVEILLQARRILGDQHTGVADGVVATGPAGLVPSGPLADGVFTLAEWRRLLYVTATERPVAQYEDGPPCSGDPLYGPTPVLWTDVPAEFPEYVNIGYGAVDGPAISLAGRILRGEAAAPDRSDTDAYFTVDSTARGGLHTVFRGP